MKCKSSGLFHLLFSTFFKCLFGHTISKHEPSALLSTNSTSTIKCFVCSPCSAAVKDAWNRPILAQCLSGEQFCYKERYRDGTVFLSCSDQCQNGTFTARGRIFEVECCSSHDGCNGLNGDEPNTGKTPIAKRESTATTALPVISISARVRKCFHCQSCEAGTQGSIRECQANETMCYREEYDDHSFTQRCTTLCPSLEAYHRQNVSNQQRRIVMTECCNDHDGCNGNLLDFSSSKSTATVIMCSSLFTILIVRFPYYLLLP